MGEWMYSFIYSYTLDASKWSVSCQDRFAHDKEHLLSTAWGVVRALEPLWILWKRDYSFVFFSENRTTTYRWSRRWSSHNTG